MTPRSNDTSDNTRDDLLSFEAVYGDDAATRAAARTALASSPALADHEAFARKVRAALPGLTVGDDDHEALMRAVTEAHLDRLLATSGDTSEDDAAALKVPDDLHQSVVAFARDHAPVATTTPTPRAPVARAPKHSPVGRPVARRARRATAAALIALALAVVVFMTARPTAPPPEGAPTVAERPQALDTLATAPAPEAPAPAEPQADAPANAPGPAIAEQRRPAPAAPPAAPPQPHVAPPVTLDDHELERLLLEVARQNPTPTGGAPDLPTLANHRPDVAAPDTPGLPVAALLARLPELRTGGDHKQLLHTTALLLATAELSPDERARVVDHRAHALEMLGRPDEARALRDAESAPRPAGR